MIVSDTPVLTFHWEGVGGSKSSWWSETDAVPGFYAVAPTVEEARRRAMSALKEIFVEEGWPWSGVRFQYHVVVITMSTLVDSEGRPPNLINARKLERDIERALRLMSRRFLKVEITADGTVSVYTETVTGDLNNLSEAQSQVETAFEAAGLHPEDDLAPGRPVEPREHGFILLGGMEVDTRALVPA